LQEWYKRGEDEEEDISSYQMTKEKEGTGI